MRCQLLAALPQTFDHVPQILWERAIIQRIGDAKMRNHEAQEC